MEGVTDVKVYDRTCDAVICYTGNRGPIVEALCTFSYEKKAHLVPEHTGRALNREFEDRLVMKLLGRAARKLFLPTPLSTVFTVVRAVKYLKNGIHCLLQGKIEVPVLDATAIAVSLIRRDFDTAQSVMFLLSVGELLEEWTHKKSVDDLARTMSLNIDRVWLKQDGQELSVPIEQVQAGDHVVVRTGAMIPLDGKVVCGEAMSNQASMTGESLPVHKEAGSYVYAGTVVEEGECVLRVEKRSGSGRYDRIVRMIEESEQLKSSAEAKASHLADRLVPYTLAGTALTYLLTRNATKALSEADAGVAIGGGAAIAREVADITLTADDLYLLLTLRRLSAALMARIHRNYRFIMSFNAGLIVLGVAGILPPATSALLHNASTLAVGLRSMTNLLGEPDGQTV